MLECVWEILASRHIRHIKHWRQLGLWRHFPSHCSSTRTPALHFFPPVSFVRHLVIYRVALCLHVTLADNQSSLMSGSIWQGTSQPVFQITTVPCHLQTRSVFTDWPHWKSVQQNITQICYVQEYMHILSLLQGSMFRSAAQCLYQITAGTWMPFQVVCPYNLIQQCSLSISTDTQSSYQRGAGIWLKSHIVTEKFLYNFMVWFPLGSLCCEI